MAAPVGFDEILAWIESLTRESAGETAHYYAEDAYFRDPFNEVHSAADIARIYRHMFDQVDAPRFRVTARWQGEDGLIIGWDFTFRMKGAQPEQKVQGLSHLRFAPDGRIAYHRDYWDPAGELYERIPLLGGLMRAVRGRLKA